MDKYVIQPEHAKTEMKREDISGYSDAAINKILAMEKPGFNGELEKAEISTLALKASDAAYARVLANCRGSAGWANLACSRR